MKRTYSICLGISAIYNIAYCILVFYANGQSYETTISATNNPFEQLGIGIGSTLVYIHLFMIVIATVFLIVAFFMRSFGFSITAGVIYSLSWIAMPFLVLFVIPSIVLTFVGAAFCKKYHNEQVEQKEEKEFRKTHPKKEKQSSGYQATTHKQEEDLSFQSRRMAYAQTQGYQNQFPTMNPMMQAQDPYAALTPNEYGGMPTMTMNQGMQTPAMNLQPIMQTPIMNQTMNPYQPYPMMQGMGMNYGSDPMQPQMNPYAQAPNVVPLAAPVYDPSWNTMDRANPMQSPMVQQETLKISEGYFDDYGNFHPV